MKSSPEVDDYIAPFPPKVQTLLRKMRALYKVAKGSVQFPFTEPLPLDLIGRIIDFRLEQEGYS